MNRYRRATRRLERIAGDEDGHLLTSYVMTKSIALIQGASEWTVSGTFSVSSV